MGASLKRTKIILDYDLKYKKIVAEKYELQSIF